MIFTTMLAGSALLLSGCTSAIPTLGSLGLRSSNFSLSQGGSTTTQVKVGRLCNMCALAGAGRCWEDNSLGQVIGVVGVTVGSTLQCLGYNHSAIFAPTSNDGTNSGRDQGLGFGPNGQRPLLGYVAIIASY